MDIVWSSFALLYLISVPVFFVIDMAWLGVVAKNFYARQLGDLLGPVKWGAAIGFYLLYLVGVTLFASYPAFAAESLQQAFVYGSLFGFFTYMTYDMTNLATLKSWPVTLVVVDVLWGTVLGAAVATATVALALAIL